MLVVDQAGPGVVLIPKPASTAAAPPEPPGSQTRQTAAQPSPAPSGAPAPPAAATVLGHGLIDASLSAAPPKVPLAAPTTSRTAAPVATQTSSSASHQSPPRRVLARGVVDESSESLVTPTSASTGALVVVPIAVWPSLGTRSTSVYGAGASLASRDASSTRYYTYPGEVRVTSGQRVGYARGRGYYAYYPAALESSLESAVAGAGGTKREMAGIQRYGASDLSPLGLGEIGRTLGDVTSYAKTIDSLVHDASQVGHTLVNYGSRVLHVSERVAISTGMLIDRALKAEYRYQLNALEVDARYGKDIAVFVKKNPSTVAWVTGALAIVAPPPLNVVLAALSMAASIEAGANDLREHKYLAVAMDVTAIATGGTGMAARRVEEIAKADQALSKVRIANLTDKVASSPPDDLPVLSPPQKSALSDLVGALSSSRSRAANARRLARRSDIGTALISLLGDPGVDPIAGMHRP